MSYPKHVHHARAMCWFGDVSLRYPSDRLATCSITEVGFVRIAGNKNIDMARIVAGARADLARLKEAWVITFLSDPLGADQLPPWVTSPKHVTDGHLLFLARAWGGERRYASRLN